MKRTFYLIVISVILSSCDSEFKPATFETTSIDNSFEASISLIYDKAEGHTELSNTINKEIETAIVSSLNSSEEELDLNTALINFNTEFVNFKTDFPEAADPKWELYIETELSYQSENLISIAINTYEFKGGAHGSDKIMFLNLDAQTGTVLKHNELIKNASGFKYLAEKYLKKSLKTEETDLKMEDLFFGKPFQLPENIGFSEDGLILLYNVYEIASYNQGYTEFIIPFEEAEAYLTRN